MKGIEGFNLRVYGLLIHNDSVLVTDEVRGGFSMTKFPGGGLEKGEGLTDCLKREFQEELGVEITVEEFCFVNDFLQISAFNPNDQLFSFYYYVNTALPYQLPTESVEIKPDGDSQNFRWIPLSLIDSNQFTFPIDKKVVSILKGDGA